MAYALIISGRQRFCDGALELKPIVRLEKNVRATIERELGERRLVLRTWNALTLGDARAVAEAVDDELIPDASDTDGLQHLSHPERMRTLYNRMRRHVCDGVALLLAERRGEC